MPSSRNVLVTLASATSGDIPANDKIFDLEDANAFISKVNQDDYAIFIPPAPHPMHTNFPRKASAAASKTKLKADLKAEKEMKAKVAMEKKAATATAKLAARTKRQEKLIAAAEIKAHKATAKAKVLTKELEDAIAVKEQDGIHTKKKSKGAAGQLSATFLSAAAPLCSPQRKQGSPKKRVSQHSPHQGEKDQSMSNEEKSMGDNVSLTSHGNGQLVSAGEGRGVVALPGGGCCYGSPGRSQHGSSSSREHSLSGSNNQQNKRKIGREKFYPGHGGRGHPGQGGHGQPGTRKGESDSASSSNSVSYPLLVLPKEMETPWCLPCLLHQQLVAIAMVTPTVTKAIRQKFSEAQLAEPGKSKDLY
jgi:hypothetical protein